jgi:hypothetical protein
LLIFKMSTGNFRGNAWIKIQGDYRKMSF